MTHRVEFVLFLPGPPSIDKKIIDLRDKVNKAIDDEDYLLASKINNEILELKKRLK